MTADQRAELLKRVMKDDQSGKLSFKDCGKIAKDLNLSLEQVSSSLIYLDQFVFSVVNAKLTCNCLIDMGCSRSV